MGPRGSTGQAAPINAPIEALQGISGIKGPFSSVNQCDECYGTLSQLCIARDRSAIEAQA